MFLYILYCSVGVYFLLMVIFKIPKSFWKKRDVYTQSYIRMAIFLFGFGLILSSLYQAFVYYKVRPKLLEGNTIKEINIYKK